MFPVECIFLLLPLLMLGRVDDGTDSCGEEGAESWGEAHGIEGRREEDGREVGAGDAYQDDGQYIVQEGEFCLAVGAEISCEAEMNCREYAVKYVGTQVFASKTDNFGLSGEEADHRHREELADKCHCHAEGDSDHHSVTQCLLAAFVMSGTGILRGDGGHRGQHRGRNEEQEGDDLLHDSDAGGHDDAAAVGDGGDHHEGYLDETVLTGGRNADAEDGFQGRFRECKVFDRKTDAEFQAFQRRKCKEHAAGL